MGIKEVFLIIFVITIIASFSIKDVFAQLDAYKNEEYGFSIEYPEGWFVSESVIKWSEDYIWIVEFGQSEASFDPRIMISIDNRDFDPTFTDQEFLEFIQDKTRESYLDISTSNPKISSINGLKAFQFTYQSGYQMSYQTGTLVTRIGFITVIPDGENYWWISASGETENWKEHGFFIPGSVKSFKLLNLVDEVEKIPIDSDKEAKPDQTTGVWHKMGLVFIEGNCVDSDDIGYSRLGEGDIDENYEKVDVKMIIIDCQSSSIIFRLEPSKEFGYLTLAIEPDDISKYPGVFSVLVDDKQIDPLNIGMGIAWKEISIPISPNTQTVEIFGTRMIPPAVTTTTQPKSIEEKVPSWIKNNAKWWSEGQIGDSDFIGGIQHLMKEKIIDIPDLPERASGTAEEKVPGWIKNNAGWWADGLIGEDDFVNGIKWLVEQGIIRV